MKHLGLIVAMIVISLAAGCSDSTPPATSYPLALLIDSQTSVNNTATLYFKVTENGTPLQGAKLRRTNFPSNQTVDLGIQSNSNGNFPRITLVLVDTMTAVAYQAVRDTLTSNYIRWPE